MATNQGITQRRFRETDKEPSLILFQKKKNPREVLNKPQGWKPMCFKSYEQYKDYIHLMRQSGNPRDNGYCLDCTPEFKAEMMECGRCAHPETRFIPWKNAEEEEVEIVGISSDSRYWSRVQRGITVLNWGRDEDDDDQQQG